MGHKNGQSLFWGQILGPSWLFWILFCLSALTGWEGLNEHLQLVFHSAAQHPSQINQSEPTLLTVSANGGMKAVRWFHFKVSFPSHLSSSLPVTNSFSSSSPPPLLKQNICTVLSNFGPFQAATSKDRTWQGVELSKSHSRWRVFIPPLLPSAATATERPWEATVMISKPKKRALAGWTGAWPRPSELCRAQLVTSRCVTPFWLNSRSV